MNRSVQVLILAGMMAMAGAQPVLAEPSWAVRRLAVTYDQDQLDQVKQLLIAVYRKRNSIDDVVAYAERQGAKCGPSHPEIWDHPGKRYLICKKTSWLIREMRMVVTFGGDFVTVFVATDPNVP